MTTPPLIDSVRRNLYSGHEHTFDPVVVTPTDPQRRSASAHRPSTRNLELPRRVRRSPRLPADRARERGAGWPGVAVDRARPPCESGARGPAAPRPDEAALPRADRT